MLIKGKQTFTHLEIAPGGTFNYNIGGGRTYYVNNITGASGNNGLSWASAFAEVSQAITAAEAYRVASWGSGTTNCNIRNTIYVAGTETAYTQLTALPQFCDIIGVGADPRGNGTGIARIGPDADGTGAVDGVNAASCRGTNFYNLQFQAGSAKAAFDCDKLFRCCFENCTFMGNNDCVTPTALFLCGVTGTTGYGGSGVVLKDCHFGSASAGGDATAGISLAGSHWHNCWIENCHIIGVTGILVAAACINGWNSVVRDCWIGTGYTTCTLSVDDNATTGYIVYRHNHLTTNGTLVSNGAARWVDNWIVNGVAPVAVTES